MSLNGSLGLGVLLEAKDMASGVISRFGSNLQSVAGKSSEAAAAIGQHMRSFGLGLTVMGAGIAGLAMLSPAIQEAKDFGKQIALVSTEVDAAVFSQSQMKAVTRSMSAEFGRLPVDEAKALYKAVALGANDAAKSTAFMTTANRLAVAGDSELAVTVDALGGTLNAYHMAATEAHVVSDAMFTAMKSGNTTVGAIAGAIGKVAPGAYEMGISLQEVLGSMAVMTNKGVEASVAVSGLHGAMANIIHPSTAASAEAKRLGIEFNAAAVRAKGFQGFLHSITDSAKFNKDSLTTLFESIEGSGAMAMLAGDMGSVDEIMRNMGKSTGATEAGFEIMSNTLTFQGDRFESLKKIALGLIGEVLEPMGASVAKLGNAILEAFNKMPAGVREFLVKGLVLASTLLVIVGGAMAAGAAIGLLSTGLGAIGITASGVAAAFLPVIGAVAVAALAFYAFRAAYDSNLGGLADAVDGAIDKIHLAFSALGQLFSDGGFSGGVLDDLNKADNMGLKNFAISVYVTVARIQAAFDGIRDGFSSVIDTMKPSFDAFMSALSGIGSAFSGLFETNDATDAASTFDGFVSAGTKIGTALGNVSKMIVSVFTVAMEIVGGFVSKLSPVGDLISTVFSVVVDVFSDIAQQMGDMNSNVDGVSGGWRALGETIGNIVAVAAAMIKSLVVTIGGVLKAAMNIVGGVLDLFTGNFERGIKRILYGIVSLIAGAVLGSIQLVATASDAVLGTHFADAIGGWRKSLDSTLQEGFGLKKHEYAAGSEEDILNRQEMTAEAQRGMAPDPLDFYAPDPMPAVAAADAQSYGPRVDADAVGAAVVAGVKGMPPATNTVIVQIGDEKVAEIVGKAQAGDQFRSGGPWIANL